MTIENEKNITTFKAYHLLILGCLLSSLIILNSNYVNNKKATLKLNKEKSKLFDEIILGRNLQGQQTGSDKVCERGSGDLVEYYKSGDLEKIGLDDKPIQAEKETYLTSLINIIKTLTNEKGDYLSGEEVASSGGEGTLRNLQSINAIQDDLVIYMKHLLPILVFFLIALLSIPGWLICCICCCCNCCCCCCCKKPRCIFPCFIFTNVFYALVEAVCIYGLSQSNKIFIGMASTECSILKFFDQFLDGETKQQLPRWAGINEINSILDNLHYKIEGLSNSNTLNNDYNNIKPAEEAFLDAMTNAGNVIYDNGNYINNININYYTGQTDPVNYILDLETLFGRHTGSEPYDGKYSENSILYIWQYEFSQISDPAYIQLTNALNGFNQILSTQSTSIIQSLDSGKDTLSELKDIFDRIKSSIADIIIDNSETIDKNGKMGFKLIFGILALINIAIAAFMFLIFCFSGRLCAKCCYYCRCIFKLAIHLLWNILAFLMIITFLVGFLFALIGRLGNDVMSVISYIVSEDNLGPNGDIILVDNIGDAKNYLYRCVNDDGKIEKEIGLEMNQIESFDKIYVAENTINQAKDSFEQIKQSLPTYTRFKGEINDRATLKSNPEFYLISNYYKKNLWRYYRQAE